MMMSEESTQESQNPSSSPNRLVKLSPSAKPFSIIAPDGHKIYWHPHQLFKVHDIRTSKRCDGSQNIETFLCQNSDKEVQRWGCSVCDFVICMQCVQSSTIKQQQLKFENETKAIFSEIVQCYQRFYADLNEKPKRNLDQLMLIVDQNQLFLTFIGITNAGKSSLINSLINIEILNTSALRETTCKWQINFSVSSQGYQFRKTAANVQDIKKQEEQGDLKFFQDQDQIISEVKQFAMNKDSKEIKQGPDQQEELKEEPNQNAAYQQAFEEISLTIPIQDNEFIDDEESQISIVDIPGIDDQYCKESLEIFLREQTSQILPVFVIELGQGQFKLEQYRFVNEAFQCTKEFTYTFIFTKFKSLIERLGIGNRRASDAQILKLAEIQVKTYQQEIQSIYKDSMFFIYDPLQESYFADMDLNLYEYEDVLEVAELYPIYNPLPLIRKFLKEKLQTQIAKNAFSRKITDLYFECHEVLLFKQKDLLSEKNLLSNLSGDFTAKVNDLKEHKVKLMSYGALIMKACDNMIDKYFSVEYPKLKGAMPLPEFKIKLCESLAVFQNFYFSLIYIKLESMSYLESQFRYAIPFIKISMPHLILKNVKAGIILSIPNRLFQQKDTNNGKAIAQCLKDFFRDLTLKESILNALEKKIDYDISKLTLNILQALLKKYEDEEQKDENINDFLEKISGLSFRSAQDCLNFIKSQSIIDEEVYKLDISFVIQELEKIKEIIQQSNDEL